MKPLTVCCVWVKGAYPYTAEYVVRLERMVRRFLPRPFRFVCLTDQPKALPKSMHVEVVETPGDPIPLPTRGIWTKLELFNPFREWNRHGHRVLFLDLDVLAVASLDPIVDFPAQFALTEDELVDERAHDTTDRYGRKIVRKFNSSVMVWDGGTQNELFTRWSPKDALIYSTDQDFVAAWAPRAVGLPLNWFPRISRVQPPWKPDVKVVLVKKPKCHIWAEKEPWFEREWGGWAA